MRRCGAGCAGFVITILVFDRHQGAAGLEFALIIMRFLLRDAEPDQGAGDASDYGAANRAGQDRREDATRDNWPDSRNAQRNDAQTPQGADACAGDHAGDGAFDHMRTVFFRNRAGGRLFSVLAITPI